MPQSRTLLTDIPEALSLIQRLSEILTARVPSGDHLQRPAFLGFIAELDSPGSPGLHSFFAALRVAVQGSPRPGSLSLWEEWLRASDREQVLAALAQAAQVLTFPVPTAKTPKAPHELLGHLARVLPGRFVPVPEHYDAHELELVMRESGASEEAVAEALDRILVGLELLEQDMRLVDWLAETPAEDVLQVLAQLG